MGRLLMLFQSKDQRGGALLTELNTLMFSLNPSLCAVAAPHRERKNVMKFRIIILDLLKYDDDDFFIIS